MDRALYKKWHNSAARGALRHVTNGGSLDDLDVDASEFSDVQWRQLNAAAVYLSDRRAAVGNRGLPLVRVEADRLSALVLAGDDLKFKDDDELDASEAAGAVFARARGW